MHSIQWLPRLKKTNWAPTRSAFLFSRHPSHDFGVVNNYILWWTKHEKLQLCGDFSPKLVTCFWRKDDNPMAQWGARDLRTTGKIPTVLTWPGFDHLVLGLLPSSLPQNERHHDSGLMIQIDSIDQTLGFSNHQKTCVYVHNYVLYTVMYVYIYIIIYITIYSIIYIYIYIL